MSAEFISNDEYLGSLLRQKVEKILESGLKWKAVLFISTSTDLPSTESETILNDIHEKMYASGKIKTNEKGD